MSLELTSGYRGEGSTPVSRKTWYWPRTGLDSLVAKVNRWYKPLGLRYCTRCFQLKEITAFYKTAGSYCKSCFLARQLGKNRASYLTRTARRRLKAEVWKPTKTRVCYKKEKLEALLKDPATSSLPDAKLVRLCKLSRKSIQLFRHELGFKRSSSDIRFFFVRCVNRWFASQGLSYCARCAQLRCLDDFRGSYSCRFCEAERHKAYQKRRRLALAAGHPGERLNGPLPELAVKDPLPHSKDELVEK